MSRVSRLEHISGQQKLRSHVHLLLTVLLVSRIFASHVCHFDSPVRHCHFEDVAAVAETDVANVAAI